MYLQLCDLDRSESGLDLYVEAKTSSDGTSYSSFLTYNGEKIIETIFNPEIVSKYVDIYHYSIEKVKGDKTFQLNVGSPINSEAIGSFGCKIKYKMSNNKITAVSTNSFEFSQYSKDYQYKTIKGFKAYDKVGSKTSAFTVKKGSTVKFDKLYITKAGNPYVRVINGKGKKGWIKAGLKDLFIECPAWG